MGELIKFPLKNRSGTENKEQKRPRKIDVDDIIASIESLGLPAEISKGARELISDIQKMPYIQRLAAKIFIQDLAAYGSAATEASQDFQKSNPNLSSKIEALSPDARRSLSHVLANQAKDGRLKDLLKSAYHTVQKKFGRT